MTVSAKARLWWPILAGWLALDIATKQWALATLQHGIPREVMGEYLRWTLGFNTGAAMGLHLGSWSRPFFTVVAIIMIGVLVRLYHTSAPHQRLQVALLAFITSGALGNLWDRLRWDRGVVDFIDVGVGSVRFWTFNVADMGISVGAVLLAIIWSRHHEPSSPAT